MNVKNYREVRAEPVVEEPAMTVRWLISELHEAPDFAMGLYEMESGAETVAHAHYRKHQLFILPGREAVIGKEGEVPLGEGDLVYVPPGGTPPVRQ